MIWNVAVSSSATSSQSARQGAKGRRVKRELPVADEMGNREPDSVFEVPPEMQQMLQTFSRKSMQLQLNPVQNCIFILEIYGAILT